MCVYKLIYMVVASKPPYAAIATVNLTRTLRAAYALTRTLRAACATLRQPWFSNVFSKAYARLAPSLRELTPAGFFRVCLTFWPSSRQSSEKLTRSLRELTHALFFNQNRNKTATNQQQNRNETAAKQPYEEEQRTTEEERKRKKEERRRKKTESEEEKRRRRKKKTSSGSTKKHTLQLTPMLTPSLCKPYAHQCLRTALDAPYAELARSLREPAPASNFKASLR